MYCRGNGMFCNNKQIFTYAHCHLVHYSTAIACVRGVNLGRTSINGPWQRAVGLQSLLSFDVRRCTRPRPWNGRMRHCLLIRMRLQPKVLRQRSCLDRTIAAGIVWNMHLTTSTTLKRAS